MDPFFGPSFLISLHLGENGRVCTGVFGGSHLTERTRVSGGGSGGGCLLSQGIPVKTPGLA